MMAYDWPHTRAAWKRLKASISNLIDATRVSLSLRLALWAIRLNPKIIVLTNPTINDLRPL